IIVTHVVNSMVNRVGPSFAHRLQEESGAAAPDIVRAYQCTREIFGLVALWRENEALDNQVRVEAQNAVVTIVGRLVMRGTVWLLLHREALADLEATIRRFAPGIAEVGENLGRWLAPHELAPIDAESERLAAQGVPPALAQRVARLDAQFSGL